MNYQEHFKVPLSEIEIQNFKSGVWSVDDFVVKDNGLIRKVKEQKSSNSTLAEIDCIFISYDEPNADKNYADLLNKAPWAKRVHGVKGSDAAHKAAADLSTTERFITIDADNIVNPKIFDLKIDFNSQQYKNKQLSWCGKNNINNLVYGNGGIKCWSKHFVKNMRTHESALFPNAKVDFCWEHDYIQMPDLYSLSVINTSPLQAFRAGFREGVKMTLREGIRQNLTEPSKQLPRRNYQRLLIWMNVGSDVINGLWSMYGARLGCYMTNCTEWDYTLVRDFDYLTNLFNEKAQHDPLEKIDYYGSLLQEHLGLPLSFLYPEQSKFFKEAWSNPPRVVGINDKWDIIDGI